MEGIFLHPNRCVSCHRCELGCALRGDPDERAAILFRSSSPAPPGIHVEPGVDLSGMPVFCLQCDPAPCEQGCPSGAMTRDRKSGVIRVDEQRCISCGMCAMLCPYSVISFYQPNSGGREVSTKCDGCEERRKQGELAACVEACPTGALEFGELEETAEQTRRTLSVAVTKGEADVPGNMELLRDIKHRMALLGPLPASSD